MSERREVRGWVPVDFASREATAVLPYRLAGDDVPVVIRHADDDAALVETLDAARRELNEAHRELGRLRARVALLQRAIHEMQKLALSYIPPDPDPEPETD